MLKAGSASIPVRPGFRVRLLFDEQLRVYLTRKEKRVEIVPTNGREGYRHFVVPNTCDGFEVEARKSAIWSYSTNEDYQEVPDPRPLEVTVEERPLSLREEMQRFIRDELSTRAAASGFDSIEDAEDFDVGDEGDEVLSPYEYHELQDDFVPPVEPEERVEAEGAQEGEQGEETPTPTPTEEEKTPPE